MNFKFPIYIFWCAVSGLFAGLTGNILVVLLLAVANGGLWILLARMFPEKTEN